MYVCMYVNVCMYERMYECDFLINPYIKRVRFDIGCLYHGYWYVAFDSIRPPTCKGSDNPG